MFYQLSLNFNYHNSNYHILLYDYNHIIIKGLIERLFCHRCNQLIKGYDMIFNIYNRIDDRARACVQRTIDRGDDPHNLFSVRP